MNIRLLRTGNADEWDQLVHRSSHSSIYHLWDWGEVLSSTYGYQRYYLGAVHNGVLVGVFPLIYVKSAVFSSKLVSLPFCEYGGPIVDSRMDNASTENIIKALLAASNKLGRFLGVQYVNVRNFSETIPLQLFSQVGYKLAHRYITFRINLTRPVDLLWRRLNKKTRNAVRKAMKRGVKLLEAEGRELLDAYFMLYLKTMRGHGSPPHAYKFFQNLYDVFYQKGEMKIMLAGYKGKPIAGILLFYMGKKIYLKSNVTDKKYRSLNPTNLLLWKTIEFGATCGYEFFDLGRTRLNTTIYRFKKGWGGQEEGLNDFVIFLGKSKKLPDPTQQKYVFLSRLWALMPMAMSRLMGPSIISGMAP